MQFFPILFSIGMVSLVLAVILWVVLARPFLKLLRILQESEKTHFLQRIPENFRGPVGPLARSLNRLLEKITTLHALQLEAERQLVEAQKELQFKREIEEKNEIIEKTNKELEKRVEEINLIHEFSQKIVSTLDLEELYRVIDSFLGDKVGFHEFALLVCNDEENPQEVVIQTARGFADSSKIRGMQFHAGEGLTGQVLQTGKYCYIPDTSQEPRYLYYKGEHRKDGSFLSIPLLFKGKLVGILNFNRPERDGFSAQDVRFLKTIAVEMAIALVNATLYSRTKELAVRDELTHLYNRRHFQALLNLEIKRADRFGQPVSLLMVDIDRFKRINDTYGHLGGDHRLREFAQLLISSLREVDMVARFGGEEFVIVLPNTSKRDARLVAEKLCFLTRQHLFSQDTAKPLLPFTISLGVASYPIDGQTVESLIKVADLALYQAKENGRDRVVLYGEGKTSPLFAVGDQTASN